jgi:hypothetical protein
MGRKDDKELRAITEKANADKEAKAAAIHDKLSRRIARDISNAPHRRVAKKICISFSAKLEAAARKGESNISCQYCLYSIHKLQKTNFFWIFTFMNDVIYQISNALRGGVVAKGMYKRAFRPKFYQDEELFKLLRELVFDELNRKIDELKKAGSLQSGVEVSLADRKAKELKIGIVLGYGW